MTAAEVVEERRAIVHTLREVGPRAPTLAGAWSAAELARHLAVQDRFWGVPAFVARRFVVATNIRLSDAYLDRPRAVAIVNAGRANWDRALHRLSASPPSAVLRPGVATVTLWEHFVHHEDVRRPAGMAPREMELPGVVDWLLRYHKRPLRNEAVLLTTPDGRSWSSGPQATLTVHGVVGELVLWLSGRGEVADVRYDGDINRGAAVGRKLAI